MENIKIGDELFYNNLSEFRMADQTNRVECRILKVRITGTFNHEAEPTRYLFTHENAQLSAVAEELSATQEEAEAIGRDKISKIAVIFKEETVKEVEEDNS